MINISYPPLRQTRDIIYLSYHFRSQTHDRINAFSPARGSTNTSLSPSMDFTEIDRVNLEKIIVLLSYIQVPKYQNQNIFFLFLQVMGSRWFKKCKRGEG